MFYFRSIIEYQFHVSVYQFKTSTPQILNTDLIFSESKMLASSLTFVYVIVLSSQSTTACYNNGSGGERYVIELISLCFQHSKELAYEPVHFHTKFIRWLGVLKSENICHYGYKVSLQNKTYDVCNSSILLLDALADITLNIKFRKPHDLDNHRIAAITSFLPEHMTKLTTEVLTMEPYIPFFPHISKMTSYLASIHPTLISPYNMINIDINIIEKQILDYNINHIAMLTIGENKYAALHPKKMLEMLTKYEHLCVNIKNISSGNYSDIKDYMYRLRRDNTIRMVLIWVMKDIPDDLLHLTGGVYNKLWYWYHTPFYSYEQEDPYTLVTMFNILHPFILSSQNIFLSGKSFKQTIRNSIYNKLLEDKYLKRFIKEKKANRNKTDIFNIIDEMESIVDEEMNPLLRLLYTLLKGIEYLKYMQSDVIVLYYFKMYTYLNQTYAEQESIESFNVTHSLLRDINRTHTQGCTKLNCQPGYEPRKQMFTVANIESRYAWICIKCHYGRVKSGYNNVSCSQCKNDLVPNINSTLCVDPYRDVYFNLSENTSMVLLIVGILSSVLNLIAIMIFIRYRKTPIIRSSGTYRSIIQMISHLLIYIAVFLLFTAEVNITYCTSQVVVTSLLLTIIMSITITKAQNLLFAFQAKVPMDKMEILISQSVEVTVFTLLVIVNGIISYISFHGDSQLLEISLNKRKLTRNFNCLTKSHFNYQLSFILALSIFCAIQGFRSRNLPQYFSETTRITYSMYITIVIILVRYPLLYSQPNDKHNLLNIIIILLLNSTQMFINFSSTVLVVLVHPERNTRRHFQEMMMKHACKQTNIEMKERAGRRNEISSSSANA